MRETRRHRLSIRSQDEYYLNIFQGLGAKIWKAERIEASSTGVLNVAVGVPWHLKGFKVNPENGECSKYRCKICDIERTKNKSGYSNLLSHLDEKHKNWRKVIQATCTRFGFSLIDWFETFLTKASSQRLGRMQPSFTTSMLRSWEFDRKTTGAFGR